MQKIVPNLWFNRNAEEAVDFYVSVFKDAKVLKKEYYPTEGLEDFQKEFAGQVLTVDYELNGQQFVAINAGPEFTLSEAVSFAVFCDDQAEIDYYWDKLSAVPAAEQCGWCKDKFGLSWQIVPKNIDDLLRIPGNYKVMMKQSKIVIAEYTAV